MPNARSLLRQPCTLMLTGALLSACGGGDAPQAVPTAADRMAIGDRLFDDTALSASGRLACATCHVESRAHASAAGVFLPLGGVNGDQRGLRSAPTLRYLSDNRAFRFNPNGDPLGGLTWDGRADNRAAQARLPLLAAHEVANGDDASVALRLRALPYLSQLLFAYSLPTSANDTQLIDAAAQALADYQGGDAKFQPYTSKFDAALEGRAALNAAEARGLALFNDLPPAYRAHVSFAAPFYPRAGAPPPLSPADVQDIVAFLHALSDGYAP